MAFREFDTQMMSRRAMMRGGALGALGAFAAMQPMGRALLAHESGSQLPWPTVTATVNDYVDSRKVANMLATLGFGQAEPQVIARGNLALNSDIPVDLDSLYRIYSMTKPVTGMATMMLIDEGKLGLDQELSDILPAFADMQVQKTYDGSVTDLEPAARPITIRHLLTHTAGLGYNIIQQGPIRDLYNERGIIPGQVTRLPIPGLFRGNPAPSLEAFADALADLPLVYQPGSKWSYSVSLDLLGRVIEVASGKSFEDFLTTRIFEPCGMDSTYFSVPQSEIYRFTTNYGVMAGTLLPIDPARASVYLDDPAFAFGGAGLVSSPRDFDRFQRMLLGFGELDGTRVMSEAAVKLGTSNLLPEDASTEGTWVAGQGFGAGGAVRNGGFGWGGAAGTNAFVHFESNLRAALYTQYMPANAYPIQSGFPELVRKDLAAMKEAMMKEAA